MSDDFCKCNNCGCEEPSLLTTNELFDNVADEILVFLELDEFNSEEDKDINFLVKKAKEILELKKHKDNNEDKCLECGEWTTLSRRHVEYDHGRIVDD